MLLVPIFVPLMVAAFDAIGLRDPGQIPSATEVLIPLVFVAVAFELVLPRTPFFQPFTYADPRDVLAYSSGALGSAIWWRVRFG